MSLSTSTVETPIGELRLVGSGTGLRAVLWPGRSFPEPLEENGSSLLADAAGQLEEYFAGTRERFSLPLDLRGTDFQRAAWLALADIPYGRTVSYAEQAHRLGRPRAVRAVGAANGRNPVPIVLPCHRIVGSDGSLTGFGGGLDVKRALLEHEGATLF
jgi:methylated-DNA-[protein]-cysteine S-methyltransferase